MSRKIDSVIVIIFTGIIIILSACNNLQNSKKEVVHPLSVVRFEQEFFSLDLYSLSDSIRGIQQEYSNFMALYSNQIIEIGDSSDPNFGGHLSKFISNQSIYSFYSRSKEVFNNFEATVELLSQGLNNYKEHFPQSELPIVYTYVSGLNQSVVTAENILGISLDKYLGADEQLYSKVYPPIPLYLKRLMRPEFIVPDAIRAWVVSDINYNPESDNLLANILNEARAVYITKQLLPGMKDTLLWGFTGEELKFCNNNESEMWKYLVEQKLLFSTDHQRISKFISTGPFTKDFTSDSPARAAVWIGYQIIDKYMSRNKSVTLSELASSNNFQLILNEARYNP